MKNFISSIKSSTTYNVVFFIYDNRMGHDFAHEAVASGSLGSVVRVKGCLVRQVIYWCKGLSNGWLPAVYHSLKD